jgi:hypothetical protein
MDTQQLPSMTSVAVPGSVKVNVEHTEDVEGLPEKGTLAQKSGYLVPLPFVGFFGKNLLLKPGETSLESPMVENMKIAMENEIAAKNPALTETYQLNIKVDSSNFQFRYRNKGFVVWLLILQFGSKKEWCSPTDLSLSVSYELKKNDEVIKKGALTKTKHSDDKVTASSQPGFADPYGAGDPMKSPTQQAVGQQYAFAFGGAVNTMQNGLHNGFTLYNQLIQETAKQVTEEITPSLK